MICSLRPLPKKKFHQYCPEVLCLLLLEGKDSDSGSNGGASDEDDNYYDSDDN